MSRRMMSKIRRPAASTMPRTMRPFWVRKTNSKKSRISGIAKAATMMPITVRRRPARSLLSGREIQ